MKAFFERPIILLLVFVVLCGMALAAYQWNYVRDAHSTFDNYYAFRGCQTLLERTDTYGTCIIASGQTIKIVKAKDGWYLDGDLPCPGPTFSVKYLSCFI